MFPSNPFVKEQCDVIQQSKSVCQNATLKIQHFKHFAPNCAFLQKMCAAWNASKFGRNLKFKRCVNCIWVNYLILNGRRMVVRTWTWCYSIQHSKSVCQNSTLKSQHFVQMQLDLKEFTSHNPAGTLHQIMGSH